MLAGGPPAACTSAPLVLPPLPPPPLGIREYSSWLGVPGRKREGLILLGVEAPTMAWVTAAGLAPGCSDRYTAATPATAGTATARGEVGSGLKVRA